MILPSSAIGPILIGAALNLDKQVFGPFMVSRPIVVGLIIGAATNEIYYGTWIGMSVELLWLASLPLGGRLIPHAGLAVAAAFIAWVASDLSPSPAPATGEAGLVASFLTVPFWAWAFTIIDKLSRSLVLGRLLRIRADLEDGCNPKLFRRNLNGLWWTFFLSIAALLAAASANSLMLSFMARQAPEIVLINLNFLFTFIPFLGLFGMAVGFIETKTSLIYFGGLLAGLLVLSAVK